MKTQLSHFLAVLVIVYGSFLSNHEIANKTKTFKLLPTRTSESEFNSNTLTCEKVEKFRIFFRDAFVVINEGGKKKPSFYEQYKTESARVLSKNASKQEIADHKFYVEQFRGFNDIRSYRDWDQNDLVGLCTASPDADVNGPLVFANLVKIAKTANSNNKVELDAQAEKSETEVL